MSVHRPRRVSRPSGADRYQRLCGCGVGADGSGGGAGAFGPVGDGAAAGRSCREHPAAGAFALEQPAASALLSQEAGGCFVMDGRGYSARRPQRGTYVMAAMGYNGCGMALATAMGWADCATGTPPEALPFPVTPPRPIAIMLRILEWRPTVSPARISLWRTKVQPANIHRRKGHWRHGVASRWVAMRRWNMPLALRRIARGRLRAR